MSNPVPKMPPISPQESRPPIEYTLPNFYTDSINLMVSPFSAVMVVGRVIGVSRGQHVIKQELLLSMSPQHLKSLWLVMGRNVTAYEERYGEIVLPAAEDHA